MEAEGSLTKNKAPVYEGTKREQYVAKLQDDADRFTRRIELERRRVEEFEKMLKVMKAKVEEQRKNMGGVYAQKESQEAVEKQIRILESRLDKALSKFNEALAHNKQLREEIDNLRRERKTFDSIYRKLEQQLHDRKKEMANIIEVANLMYEARDKAQEEMKELKMQFDRENDAHQAQLAELNQQLLQLDGRMRELELSLRRPIESVQETRHKKKSEEMVVDKETKERQEKLRMYEDAFKRIQDVTGIENIDELVEQFIKAEDENFAMFRRLNTMQEEIEEIEGHITDLKREIVEYREKNSMSQTQKGHLFKQLQERITETEKRAEMFDNKYTTSIHELEVVYGTVKQMFERAGCSWDVADSASGEISESNIMIALGMIEERINVFLMRMAAQEPQAGGGKNYDTDESESLEERPLTRDEIKVGPSVAMK
eukprot:tig00020918_g15891.t1